MDLSSDSLISRESHEQNDIGSAAYSNSFDEDFSDPLHSPRHFTSAFSAISGNETSPISTSIRSPITLLPPTPKDLPMEKQTDISPFSDGFGDHHFESWENTFQPLPELPSHEIESIPVNRRGNSLNTARNMGHPCEEVLVSL